jgi:hypothetical protein
MTRKDFQVIADSLRAALMTVQDMDDAKAHEAWKVCCREVASGLAGTNPRFDRQRFLDACTGVK